MNSKSTPKNWVNNNACHFEALAKNGCGGQSRTDCLLVMSQAGYRFPTPLP